MPGEVERDLDLELGMEITLHTLKSYTRVCYKCNYNWESSGVVEMQGWARVRKAWVLGGF